MKILKKVYSLLFFLIGLFIYAQGNSTLKPLKNKEVIRFEWINNQIVFGVKLNEQSKVYNFILDTGSQHTMVFEDIIDSENKNEKIVHGLGKLKSIKSNKISNQKLKVARTSIELSNLNIYKMEDYPIDLKSKFGKAIHGIIGFDLLKNTQIKIDYSQEKITFYSQDYFQNKTGLKKGYTESDLFFKSKKPYINTFLSLNNSSEIPMRLLIDTGSSDALWLINNGKYELPNNAIEDILGYGLNGVLLGKRAYANRLKINGLVIDKPTVSVPDNSSVKHVNTKDKRDGSLGTDILSRFDVMIDYSNRKIYLKKNAFFKDKFNLNLVGVELDYSDKNVDLYQIMDIRKESPAKKIGLQKGDVITNINNNYIGDLSRSEVFEYLYGLKGENLTFTINREGQKKKYQMNLEY